MTRALICTGVLGGGTAVVFALALAASLLFPQGSMVSTGWNGGWSRPAFPDRLEIRGLAPAPAPWEGDGGDVTFEQAAPDVIAPAIPAPAPVAVES
jgi:hypothetical protein